MSHVIDCDFSDTHKHTFNKCHVKITEPPVAVNARGKTKAGMQRMHFLHATFTQIQTGAILIFLTKHLAKNHISLCRL